MILIQLRSTLFPYTTLFRSQTLQSSSVFYFFGSSIVTEKPAYLLCPINIIPSWDCRICLDRKSTRLNSSHVAISYAVFCLIEKTINQKVFYIISTTFYI